MEQDLTIPTSRHFYVSFLAGAFAGAASAWILAYLVALPMMLGVVFFLLDGVMVGMLVSRIAQPAMPVRKQWLWLSGSSIALLTVVVGLAIECELLPDDVAGAVLVEQDEDMPEQAEQAQVAAIGDSLAGFLENGYPPGGFLGYLHWAAADGKFIAPHYSDDRTTLYELPQAGWAWVIRVVLSLACLAGGIFWQILPLTGEGSFYEDYGDFAGR